MAARFTARILAQKKHRAPVRLQPRVRAPRIHSITSGASVTNFTSLIGMGASLGELVATGQVSSG
jgi:hypothetical protein